MAKLTKIARGHYRNDKGEARNVKSSSGAPHTRNSRAKWLVTRDGKSQLVPTLEIARTLLS